MLWAQITIGLFFIYSMAKQIKEEEDKETDTVALFFSWTICLAFIFGMLYFAGCFDQIVPSVWEEY